MNISQNITFNKLLLRTQIFTRTCASAAALSPARPSRSSSCSCPKAGSCPRWARRASMRRTAPTSTPARAVPRSQQLAEAPVLKKEAPPRPLSFPYSLTTPRRPWPPGRGWLHLSRHESTGTFLRTVSRAASIWCIRATVTGHTILIGMRT